MDAFGHVVVPYSAWMPFREMLTIATGDAGAGPLVVRRSVQHRPATSGIRPMASACARCCSRASRSFRPASASGTSKHDIIEIGGDIAGAPKGCLIGLDAGDELLEDYRRVIALHTTAEQRGRRLDKQLTELRAVNDYAVGRGQPAGTAQAVPPCQAGRRALPPLEGLGHLRGADRERRRCRACSSSAVIWFMSAITATSSSSPTMSGPRFPKRSSLKDVLAGKQPAKQELAAVSAQLDGRADCPMWRRRWPSMRRARKH